MTYHYKSLGLVAKCVRAPAAALAIRIALTLSPIKADAAVIYATEAEEIGDASGVRGTKNNRDEIADALGNDFDTFFELGFGGVVEFQFGNPAGQKFLGPDRLWKSRTATPMAGPKRCGLRWG